jgi:hypothetical protein
MPQTINEDREPRVPIAAQVPIRIHEKVRAIAITEDRTVSAVIRRIMEDWYKQQ